MLNSSQLMTPDHPRWMEFCERLEGPEGCDFKAGVTWSCAGGMDKTKSAAILAAMGFSPGEVAESLAYFEAEGGHCDCEILFNLGQES